MHLPSSPPNNDCPSIGVGRTDIPSPGKNALPVNGTVVSCSEKCKWSETDVPVVSINPSRAPRWTNWPTLTGIIDGPIMCMYMLVKRSAGWTAPDDAAATTEDVTSEERI